MYKFATSSIAQEAYASLSLEDSLDYEKVKHAIFHRFDIMAESYRQRFQIIHWPTLYQDVARYCKSCVEC